MQVEGRTLKEALAQTSEARPVIDINAGFKKALMKLEADLRPNEPPSVVLDLSPRFPVLSSASRPPKAARRKSSEAGTGASGKG